MFMPGFFIYKQLVMFKITILETVESKLDFVELLQDIAQDIANGVTVSESPKWRIDFE